MSWSTQVFVYCERGLDPAFWAEPLNALSNAAFLVAAAFGFVTWLRRPPDRRGASELALVVLVLAIAIGSFLFHTLATRWAALADTLPIGAFMAGYLGFALRRYLAFGALATVAALVVFFALLAGASMTRCGGGPCLNGSLAYVPALAALVVIGAALLARGHAAGRALLAAGAILAVSLTFRTVDRTLCPLTAITGARPLGTHALWHVLNALLIHLLLQAALASPPRARD